MQGFIYLIDQVNSKYLRIYAILISVSQGTNTQWDSISTWQRNEWFLQTVNKLHFWSILKQSKLFQTIPITL